MGIYRKLPVIVLECHDFRLQIRGLVMPMLYQSEKRKERLLQLDLSEDEISRLHAPVGLPIGSKTPSEIAISIIAQLSLVRNQNKFVEKENNYIDKSESS